MNHVTLNDGNVMPILGFGVFQIPAEETEKAVVDALAAGYRLIDTAASYGNEEAVGRAIANSGIDRSEIFVTTKLWIQKGGFDASKRACISSLEKLGLDYADLYLIHQPLGDYYSEWRAMEELQKEGKVRSIGVSNFAADRLVDLIAHNTVVPAVNQMETNPFHQQTEYQALLESKGVQLESWGPFAEGRNSLFTNPLLTAIGEAHGKSTAQVVLRWLIQREVVVVAKTVSRDRMAQNLHVFDFELTDDEMKQVAGLDSGASQFFDHRDPKMVEWLNSRADG